MNNGDSVELISNITTFPADTFDASMMTAVVGHPISGKPMVNTIVVGGMSKRLGIAMNLMQHFLRVNDVGELMNIAALNSDSVDSELQECAKLAFDAAEALIREGERRERMEKALAETGAGS